MKKITCLVFLVAIVSVFSFGSNAFADQKVNWKMGSCFSASINVNYGEAEMIKYVKEMSDGNFNIQQFHAGALMPALEHFDAVQKGVIQAAGEWPGYWASKDLAFDTLGSFPLGFTYIDYINWLYQGGGLEMVQDLYKKYGMTWFPIGMLPVESGFWLTEKSGPIKTIADYKGKKLRTSARASITILTELGASPVMLTGDETYLGLQRGTVDGGEFATPGVDLQLGLSEVTKYWSAPSWFQTASVVGFMINLEAWNALSKKNQAILKYACQAAAMKSMTFWDVDAARAVHKLKDMGMVVSTFSMEEYPKLAPLVAKYAIMQAKKSPGFAKLLKSQIEFRKFYQPWREIMGPFGQGHKDWWGDQVLPELKKMGY